MRYAIGIDLGTTAVKAILLNEEGGIVHSASRSYPLYNPQNGWAEQDPCDWKRAVFEVLSEIGSLGHVEKEDIKGIGFSGQMHGLVLLDGKGNPLGRSIIWCDQRSGQEAEDMKGIMPEEEWIRITGNPPIAAWTAAKYLWVRKNRPELLRICRHILLPKDYIRFCLTGKFDTDASDASGMQMLDVEHRCWSKEILGRLGIDERLLGAVHESQDPVGTLLPEVADACGLSSKTIVVAGAADNAAAGVGTGVVREGDSMTSIGTSAILYSHLNHYVPVPEGKLHLCCAAIPGTWFTMGGPQAACLSQEWFKNNFCGNLERKAEEAEQDFYDYMNDMAARIPIGSDRLLFLPFLMGERTPHLDPFMRGAFIGLSSVHTEIHMLRAIMEGVSYCLADCSDIMTGLGKPISRSRACGGGLKGRLWRQMLADIYGCDIEVLKSEEGPALGAAILAGAGSGLFANIPRVCDQFISVEKIIHPIQENIDTYRKYHEAYGRFYDCMKTEMDRLYGL